MNKFLLSLVTSLSIVTSTAFAMDVLPEEEQNPFARKLPRDLQVTLSHHWTGNYFYKIGQTCTENYRTFMPLAHHVNFSVKPGEEHDSQLLPMFRHLMEIPEGESVFSKLPCLSSLNLDYNTTFPFKKLTELTALQSLSLARASTSKIPTIESVLYTLPNLTLLNVRFLEHYTHPYLWRLTKLKVLGIGGANFYQCAGDNPQENLSQLTNLEALFCEGLSKINEETISHLTNLKILSFGARGMRSASLARVTSLHALQLTEGTHNLDGLSNIRTLYLKGDCKVTFSWDLTNLEVLSFDISAKRRDPMLEHYTKLKALEMMNYSVELSADFLNHFSNLTYLNVYNNSIRTNDLRLPKLETLIINSEKLLKIDHYDMYKEWAPFPKLRTLMLHYPVKDDSSEPYMLTAVDLECLPNLQKLITHGVELSGDAQDYLSDHNAVHEDLPEDSLKFPPLPSLD